MDTTERSGAGKEVRWENDIHTYYHSGAAGDVIYALPALITHARTKNVAGMFRIVLNNSADVSPSPAFTEQSAASLIALLEVQPYIDRATYDPALDPPPLYNVDAFRKWALTNEWVNDKLTITEAVCRVASVPNDRSIFQWLKCGRSSFRTLEDRRIDVILSRSSRYHGIDFPWRRIVEKLWYRSGFIGTDAEYITFCAKFGSVPRINCGSCLDIANAINGAKLFIGNQSLPLAIAEALKKPLIQECWPQLPNCIWKRSYTTHHLSGDLAIPDVDLIPE